MPDLSDTVAKCRMGTAKKFYTSIASLSHTSKIARDETAYGGRRCGAHRYDPRAAAQRAVRLIPSMPQCKTLRPCPPDTGGGGKGGLTHWI